MPSVDWIAVDWGTTSFRAWAMSGQSAVDEIRASDGMATLSRDAFEPALLAHIAPWLTDAPITIVACGMVGARQGWVEAPYRSVPCTALPEALCPVPVQDPRLTVWIAPGLSKAAPPDVMRGEETQIAGFLAANPGWDGVICLPGTHTKWVHVSADEVISFQSFMTGEMFALLSKHSVLKHSMDEGWQQDSFLDAVSDTLSQPERLARDLFGIRATDLLSSPAPGHGVARLSGLLIGAELAATRPYWLGQAVALIGDDAITAPYAAALDLQGLVAIRANAGSMTRLGLACLYEKGP